MEKCLVQVEYIIFDPNQVVSHKTGHHFIPIWKYNMSINFYLWIHLPTQSHQEESDLNHEVRMYQKA